MALMKHIVRDGQQQLQLALVHSSVRPFLWSLKLMANAPRPNGLQPSRIYQLTNKPNSQKKKKKEPTKIYVIRTYISVGYLKKKNKKKKGAREKRKSFGLSCWQNLRSQKSCKLKFTRHEIEAPLSVAPVSPSCPAESLAPALLAAILFFWPSIFFSLFLIFRFCCSCFAISGCYEAWGQWGAFNVARKALQRIRICI